MTRLARFLATTFLFMAVSHGALAGPPFYLTQDPPPPPPGGWNTTDVDVHVEVRGRIKGTPSITYWITGAQETKPRTVAGFWATAYVRTEGVSEVTATARDDSGPGGINKLRVRIDSVPPVTSIPGGVQYVPGVGNYVATIVATDPAAPGGNSGVKEIRYSIDGHPDTVAHSDRTGVYLPATGWKVLVYYGVDHAGNVEYPYNTFTPDAGMEVVPEQVEITAGVGDSGSAQLSLRQLNPTFPVDVLSIETDSPHFRPDGSCVFPMRGVINCTTRVFFHPPAVGDFAATLFIRTNDPDRTYYTAELRGRGVLPGMSLTPDPVEFPITAVGSRSPARTVRIASDGAATLVVSGLSIASGAFPIVDDRCAPRPLTLAPGAACEVDIAFEPFGFGMHPGALEVQSNLPGPARFVPFEAFGTVPAQLSATPAAPDLGTVPVGYGEKLDVTIENPGTTPFLVRDFSLGGAGAAMYRIAHAQCTNGLPPTTLEPRQVCVVTVEYLPSAPGQHDALLRMNSSIGLPPFEVPLTGASP